MKTLASRVLLSFLLLAFVTSFTRCGGGGDGGTPPDPSEQNLQIELDPNSGQALNVALTARFDFKVLIKSTIPPAGVDVTVTGKRESDNSQFYNQTGSGTTTTINTFVDNLPTGSSAMVTVLVRSKGNTNNQATATLRVIRK